MTVLRSRDEQISIPWKPTDNGRGERQKSAPAGERYQHGVSLGNRISSDLKVRKIVAVRENVCGQGERHPAEGGPRRKKALDSHRSEVLRFLGEREKANIKEGKRVRSVHLYTRKRSLPSGGSEITQDSSFFKISPNMKGREGRDRHQPEVRILKGIEIKVICRPSSGERHSYLFLKKNVITGGERLQKK